MTNYHLYFDDSGSRCPDNIPKPARADGMDYFALGGILIKELDIPVLMDAHRIFCARWNIDYPLHSTKIRGRRGSFAWLTANPEKEQQFLVELEQMLLSFPIIGIACVVDRTGYVARYQEKYDGKPWQMCKTAFAILIERACKYTGAQDGTLELFFEQAGKAEDTDIKNYLRMLKSQGMPFDRAGSGNYAALEALQFTKIIKGDPREKTKKFAPVQIADLMLYPMIKGGYDSSYPPYTKLLAAGRLVDSHYCEEAKASLGIKYFCFPMK